MASGKTHPHIDSPDDAQIRQVLTDRSPEIQDTYLGVHHLILETLPDISNSIDTVDGATGYAEKQYGYDGWGMLALMPAKGWAHLAFMRGALLDDPEGNLQGSGKTMRGIKFRTPEEVEAKAGLVRRHILAASRLMD